MEDTDASIDRWPRCGYLGCSQPAIYGVERAHMGTALYCLQHMREIARRKSSGRTPAPSLQGDEPELAIMLQGLRAQPALPRPLPTPTVSPEQMDDVLIGARKVRRGNPADGEFG